MEAYMFINNGMPIFDTNGAVITLNSSGQPVDLIGNMVTITTSYGLPKNGTSLPREIPQLSTPSQFYVLIYF